MYKYAVLHSLVKLAEEKSKDKDNKSKQDKSTSKSTTKTQDTFVQGGDKAIEATDLPDISDGKYDFYSISPYEMTPITLSKNDNAAMYALRSALERGSGKNLKLKAYRTNDIRSATDMRNIVRYNPNNTAIATHEYGHVIDQPNMYLRYVLDMVHPALGEFYNFKQEQDANRVGIDAFRRGTTHNKSLGDALDRVQSMTRDKALDTYRIRRNYRSTAGILGSLLGGGGGYLKSVADKDDTPWTVINTLVGAWGGGRLGGYVGGALAKPVMDKKVNELTDTMASKEYADAMNNFNRDLLLDARANNWYQPVATAPVAVVNS